MFKYIDLYVYHKSYQLLTMVPRNIVPLVKAHYVSTIIPLLLQGGREHNMKSHNTALSTGGFGPQEGETHTQQLGCALRPVKVLLIVREVRTDDQQPMSADDAICEGLSPLG